ncbi:MAG: glycosyltransferase [Nitrospira sp.]|nr:glycosyltransferase [Nitrospira sp.]
MKILFLVRALNYGGAERQLVALAKGLHERGHHVVVAVFYSRAPLEKDLLDSGIRIRSLEKGGRWDLINFFLRYLRLVQEERPDLIHGYLGDPNIVIALAKLMSPGSRIVWGVRSSSVDLTQYDWVSRSAFTVGAWLSGWADCIIANSYAGRKDYLAKGYPSKKTITIHNGIDTDRFSPDQNARLATRQAWNVPDSHILIGLVGRINPQKDHRNFILAAARVLQERQDVRFVCVGGGAKEDRASLEDFAKSLGLGEWIIWMGAHPEVSHVYNALDLLVSSSAYGEGFSNVIGEAMACGLPCVATDVGDARLILNGLGECVPPRNPEALCAGIHRVLKDPRPGLVLRQHIIEHFSLKVLLTKTEQVLLDLMVGQAHDRLVPEGEISRPRS